MLRILGQISIYGTKASIERFVSIAPIPTGKIVQAGLKRTIPEIDSWCYASAWYGFRLDTLDEEVFNFLIAHAQVGHGLATRDPELRYAFLTLCPVNQSADETFAFVLGHETVQALSSLGVSFQIAPESVMPEMPYWVPDSNKKPPATPSR